MKLSTNELKQIIKEELGKLLNEEDYGSVSLNTLMGMYYDPEDYGNPELQILMDGTLSQYYLEGTLNRIDDGEDALMVLEEYLSDPSQVNLLEEEYPEVLEVIQAAIVELRGGESLNEEQDFPFIYFVETQYEGVYSDAEKTLEEAMEEAEDFADTNSGQVMGIINDHTKEIVYKDNSYLADEIMDAYNEIYGDDEDSGTDPASMQGVGGITPQPINPNQL